MARLFSCPHECPHGRGLVAVSVDSTCLCSFAALNAIEGGRMPE